MKLLLVKTSSLGDVIHALPAVTEAADHIENLSVDWVVEENFTAVPALHPAVQRVIPLGLRRWRRHPSGALADFRRFLAELRGVDYDLVIDSQGLIKSALVSVLARGQRHGFDRQSAREPLSALFYQQCHPVGRALHAVHRQKQLFAQVLGYQASGNVDYGLGRDPGETGRDIWLLHGTTWSNKEWPLRCWQAVAGMASGAGFRVVIPAGNSDEARQAEQIAEGAAAGSASIVSGMSLAEVFEAMTGAAGAVSVDSGLGHMATALAVPLVAVFGATDPSLTGMKGTHTEVIVSDHLPCIPCVKRTCQYPKPDDSSSIYPPCFERTSPESVWQALQRQISSSHRNNS